MTASENVLRRVATAVPNTFGALEHEQDLSLLTHWAGLSALCGLMRRAAKVILDQPFVRYAANGSKEPIVTDAAICMNGSFCDLVDTRCNEIETAVIEFIHRLTPA